MSAKKVPWFSHLPQYERETSMSQQLAKSKRQTVRQVPALPPRVTCAVCVACQRCRMCRANLRCSKWRDDKRRAHCLPRRVSPACLRGRQRVCSLQAWLSSAACARRMVWGAAACAQLYITLALPLPLPPPLRRLPACLPPLAPFAGRHRVWARAE